MCVCLQFSTDLSHFFLLSQAKWCSTPTTVQYKEGGRPQGGSPAAAAAAGGSGMGVNGLNSGASGIGGMNSNAIGVNGLGGAGVGITGVNGSGFDKGLASVGHGTEAGATPRELLSMLQVCLYFKLESGCGCSVCVCGVCAFFLVFCPKRPSFVGFRLCRSSIKPLFKVQNQQMMSSVMRQFGS